MKEALKADLVAFLNEATAVPSFLYLGGLLLLLGVIFAPLETCFPANRQRLIYKGLKLDLIYWFMTPIVTKMFTNYALAGVLVTLIAIGLYDADILNGFGPLSRQPYWLQGIEVLLLADLIDYWTHRGFHTSSLWRFHAIHHSPEELNWISSARMHPINDLLTRLCQVIPIVLLGFSARPAAIVVPAMFFYVIFLHSNLSWRLGPLRYVLVSPAYHRWHHTSEAAGIDKNFAGIFPIWDLLFGTCYFPDHLPKKYGVAREKVPETFFGQLVYPFKAARLKSRKKAPVS